MASYVESATLRVIDQSSAPLGRIDAALKRLHATARSMASTRVNIDTSGANRGLETLQNQMRQLSRGAVTTSVNVNTTAARRAVDSLTSHMRGLGLGGRGNASTLAIGANMAGVNQVRAGLAAIANSVRRINATPLRIPAGPVGGAPQVPVAQRYPIAAALIARRGGQTGDGPPDAVTSTERWVGRAFMRRAFLNTGQAGHNIAMGAVGGAVAADTQRVLTNLFLHDNPELARQMHASALAVSARYPMVTAAGLMDVARQAITGLQAGVSGMPADQQQAAMIERTRSMMEIFGQSAQLMSLLFGNAQQGANAALQHYRGADIAGVADEPARLAEYMRMMAISNLIFGRDMNPQMMASTFQRGGIARMGLDAAALPMLFMTLDESRGMAANSWRTFVQDLQRPNLAAANADRMRAAGMRGADNLPTNAALLASNPWAWIAQFHPAARAHGLARGVDIDDTSVHPAGHAQAGQRVTTDAQRAAAISAYLYDAGLHSSSATFALSALMKQNELQVVARMAAGISRFFTDSGALESLHRSSLLGGWTAVGSQGQNLVDQTTSGWLQPIIKSVLGGITSLFSAGANSPYSALGILGLGAGAIGYGAHLAVQHPLVLPAGLLSKAGMDLITAAAALKAALLGRNAPHVVPHIPHGASVPSVPGSQAGSAAQAAARYVAGGLGAAAAVALASGQVSPTRWQAIKTFFSSSWSGITGAAGAGATWLGNTYIGRGIKGLAGSWLGKLVAAPLRLLMNKYVQYGLLGDMVIGAVTGWSPLNAMFGWLFGGSAHAATPGGPTARRTEPLTLLERAQQRLDELAAGRRPYDPPPGDQGGGGAFLGGVQGAAPTLIDTAAAQMLQSGQMVVQGASMFEVAAMSIADAGPVLQAGIEAGAAAGAEMFAARIAEAAAAININVAAPAAGANTGANPGIAR